MKALIAALVVFAATPLLAADITVEDAYARIARPGAPTGAMFMTIHNSGETPDRLIEVRSNVAQVVELHTHVEDGGVMRMRPVEGGMEIPAGGTHELARGGDHVMLMGLTASFQNGDIAPLTLVFEHAGEITVDVPIDNNRQQGHHGSN